MRFRSALILLCLIGACDRPADPVAEVTSRQIPVFASTFPLADLARQVGGVHVRVDWLIDLGDPLNGLIPTPAERQRLAGSELVLLDGPRRWESWANQDLSRAQAGGRLVSLEDLDIARTMPSSGLLQLDPVAIKAALPVLAHKLGQIFPRQKAEFETRAKQLVAEIDALLQAHPNSVFGRGRVVVLDDTFVPLLDRFSIAYTRIDGDPLRLSDRDADGIRTKAAQENARVLLVPYDTPTGTIADLQTRTGLRVVPLDPLGYPNFAGHGSYLDVLKFNLAQLKAATRE